MSDRAREGYELDAEALVLHESEARTSKVMCGLRLIRQRLVKSECCSVRNNSGLTETAGEEPLFSAAHGLMNPRRHWLLISV